MALAMDIWVEVALKFPTVNSGGFWAAVVPGRGRYGEGAEVSTLADLGKVSVLQSSFLPILEHVSGGKPGVFVAPGSGSPHCKHPQQQAMCF